MKFGTDGLRGVANEELTPELVLALGRSAARVLGDRFLVGRDTRISSPLLQAALSAGLSSEGADVVDLGVLPTPGVAWASAADGVAAAMISASHNPYSDNGVKFFAAGGRKLPDELEAGVEAELSRLLESQRPAGGSITGAGVGRFSCADTDAAERYAASLVASLEGRRLDGLTAVLDCANGAAWALAPRVLRELGATVEVLNDRPDGVNINAGCGSTHPEGLQQEVLDRGADVGLALDGDADRVLAVDHRGGLVDGDHILAVCARDQRARGVLKKDTVVVTVMTNLGFRKAMQAEGIEVLETKVGDRYVLEALERGGWSLGGEQSGHLIFRDLATTGDGILTGVQLLDAVCRSAQPLAELSTAAMTRLPQVLRNVRVTDRRALENADDLWREVAHVEAAMEGRGRVLIRPSGTEPLVRVMVEAPTTEEAEAAVARLCAVVERLGMSNVCRSPS